MLKINAGKVSHMPFGFAIVSDTPGHVNKTYFDSRKMKSAKCNVHTQRKDYRYENKRRKEAHSHCLCTDNEVNKEKQSNS